MSDTIIHDNTAPLAPVIPDISRSFNASFTTSIEQGVPADSNFKEFHYTLTGTDPTCSTGTVSTSQPTSVVIPAANTTLKAISCDQVGQASAVASVTYTYDNSAPTVVITTSSTSPTKVSPIPVTITFSKAVTGFDVSDITVGNGTAGSFAGSGATYTANITPTAQGAVTVNVAANRAQDAANNGNTAGSQLSVTYDSLSPTVTITSTASATTNVSPIPVTITFSESVTGFDVSDLTVGNGSAGSFSGSGTTYTASVTPAADGIVTVNVLANVAQDAAANGNTAATQLSRTYDSTPPSTPGVVINSGDLYTSTTAATLTLSAGEASEMYVSNTAGCATGGTWEAYGTSKSWTLGQTNDTATVYAKFRDSVGNETACVSDTIIHDNTAPLAPVIPDISRSFNASFTTSIEQGVPADSNFKEFHYTLTGTDPTCSTGTVSTSQPTSVVIPAANTTLKAISCDQVGQASAVVSVSFTFDITPPNAPTVTGTTPTENSTPTWSWVSGAGGGNGTYRYKLNSSDFSVGATETTTTTFTPASALTEATHTLYVQERDAAGNWSTSGSFAIQVVTPPVAPTLSTPTRNVGSLSLMWASVAGATSYNLYWSTVAGVTTGSTKISNVASVHTHTPLTGGTTYYYKLAAEKNGIESALSNEVSAAPYSYGAPTVSAISPNSGTAKGGTSVTITGTGFVSGATVSIGGANATGVTFASSTSLNAITPAGSIGAQNLVVTNPDGQTGTLVSGFTFTTPTCTTDCYLEGSSPNFAQALAVGTERQGPSGANLTLEFANGASGFKIWREKNGSRILNASGIVSNGWQQTLARSGTAFSGSDVVDATNISQIAGRVCPIHVFLSHLDMTATNRCLYYDSGNPAEKLNAAIGTEGEDWLSQWNNPATGRGIGSSYFEGNVKTCADKGMRLPTMYETTSSKPSSYLPTGDTGVNPTWAGSTDGVPSFGALYADTRTASASTYTTLGSIMYFSWYGSTASGTATGSGTSVQLRCVLPNNIPACISDCYLEGSAPNYAQDLSIGTERIGPSGSTLTLQYATGSSGFKIWKEKGGTRILNSSGLVSNSWQKQLTRSGTAFSATDFSNGANIGGRTCPSNVFLSHTNMTATNRCLYYDSGNSVQALDSAGTGGVEASDWLQNWNRAATGRGTGSSYYEGNIKTCADKGMRLPTLYETSADPSASAYLPTSDGISPIWSLSTGVPHFDTTGSWTASGNTGDFTRYFRWRGTSILFENFGVYSNTDRSVRCVIPNDAPPSSYSVEYLIVGGGGGGGSNVGGGGGAGGLRSGSQTVSSSVAYAITVGAGGAGGTNGSGSIGGNSIFAAITGQGGGGGGANLNGTWGGAAPASGGSGGGGAHTSAGAAGNTPSSTPSQGRNGGNGASTGGGGGGGGASALGVNASGTNGGAGGAGQSSSITGVSISYAGGGGGGHYGGTAGAGGTGGGGAGGNTIWANTPVAGAAGSVNSGGGGGGGGHAGGGATGGAGGSGGSGVVIIAYPSSQPEPSYIESTLVYTVDTVTRNGYRVYKFTSGSGNIYWP